MDTLPDHQSNGSPHRREKSRDSLVYLTTCMIGHLVEVHLTNGSVYSGIFHAADLEKDFGIVLKMASLIKDSTLRGHKSRSEFFRKPPLKTFIVPADELVQVVAEDLSVSSDGTLITVQSEKPVVLLTDSSSGKGYEDGDSQPSSNNTKVDQSCSISGDDARHLSSEQRSEDFPAPGSSISESQLGERKKNNGPEVSHSSRSAEESVSGHGGNQVTDIKEGTEFSGGGTSASKTVAEKERQGSQVSGKNKSESSFQQSDSRSSERRPAPSTPSRPGLPPSSSIGSSSLSEKFTCNPDAEEFKPSPPPAPVQAQSPTEYTSFYCPAEPTQQMPVQAQFPMADGSFYCPAAPLQQMPVQAQYPMADGSFYCPAAPTQQMPVLAQIPMADGSFYYPAAAPLQQMPVQAQYPMADGSFYCPAAPTQQMPVLGQYPMADGSFYYPAAAPLQQMPVQAQYPMADGSFYYPAAPVQHMPVQGQYPMADGSFYYPAGPLQQMPGGYGIQPQYFEQQMFYNQYYGQQYGQTGYPQYAQAQYPPQQQMMMLPRPQTMMGQPPRPPPPYHQPRNPYNEGRE